MSQTFDISNYEFRSNNLNLKYKRFTLSSCREIGIRKLKFVAKTQFAMCERSAKNLIL